MSIIHPGHESYQHHDRRELPPFLWRTFYEGSYTPSCYVASNVNEHLRTPSRYFTHVKSQVSKENAFQAREKFVFEKDLTKKRVSEHLVWACRLHSSFVSAFDSQSSAEFRAQRQFHKQGWYKQERVAIAKISTANLSPATYRPLPNLPRSHSRPMCGDVPIWIDLTKFSADMTTITKADFMKHLPDVWLSMAEIRYHFGISNQGQNDEWVACGAISLSRVTQVIPYDGQLFHEKAKVDVDCNGYVFNFQHRMWLLERTRMHDCEVLKLAYLRVCKLRHSWQQMYKITRASVIEQGYLVSDADICRLNSCWRKLGDVTRLIITYYEKIPRNIDQHDGLSLLAEIKRDQFLGWKAKHERETQNVERLMRMLSTSKSKVVKDTVAADELTDAFGVLTVNNDA